MKNLDFANELSRLSQNNVYESIRTLLRENNFSQERKDVPKSLSNYLDTESQKFNFKLPKSHITMMYFLGDLDFDEAQLILPNSKMLIRNLESNLTLSEIRNVSEGVSKLLPQVPVIEIYTGNEFSLPRFIEYSNGKISYESNKIGSRFYTESFRDENRENLIKKFKKLSQKSLLNR